MVINGWQPNLQSKGISFKRHKYNASAREMLSDSIAMNKAAKKISSDFIARLASMMGNIRHMTKWRSR